jgi:hypothetical protein
MTINEITVQQVNTVLNDIYLQLKILTEKIKKNETSIKQLEIKLSAKGE